MLVAYPLIHLIRSDSMLRYLHVQAPPIMSPLPTAKNTIVTNLLLWYKALWMIEDAEKPLHVNNFIVSW